MNTHRLSPRRLLALVAGLGIALTTVRGALGTEDIYPFDLVSDIGESGAAANASALPGGASCKARDTANVTYELEITAPLLAALQSMSAAQEQGSNVAISITWTTERTMSPHGRTIVTEMAGLKRGGGPSLYKPLYDDGVVDPQDAPGQQYTETMEYGYAPDIFDTTDLRVGTFLTVQMKATAEAFIEETDCGKRILGASAQWRVYRAPKLTLSSFSP